MTIRSAWRHARNETCMIVLWGGMLGGMVFGMARDSDPVGKLGCAVASLCTFQFGADEIIKTQKKIRHAQRRDNTYRRKYSIGGSKDFISLLRPR